MGSTGRATHLTPLDIGDQVGASTFPPEIRFRGDGIAVSVKFAHFPCSASRAASRSFASSSATKVESEGFDQFGLLLDLLNLSDVLRAHRLDLTLESSWKKFEEHSCTIPTCEAVAMAS